MDHFPIFLSTKGQRIVLSGGGDAALAKLRLLMKSQAKISVYATDPAPELVQWADAGRLTLPTRPLQLGDVLCANRLYPADQAAVGHPRHPAIPRAKGP
mgnify:CR=1 FL=1